jgi:CRP-like cAMP-binding protein
MGRLAARIVELAGRYGEHDQDGRVTVALPLTREELATWTGASRAGLAEALKQLRELGWVQAEGSTLTVLDLDALRARTGAAAG